MSYLARVLVSLCGLFTKAYKKGMDDLLLSHSCSQNKRLTSSNYWSSTTNASNATNAWNVNFNNGNDNWNNKTDTNYVRCVR